MAISDNLFFASEIKSKLQLPQQESQHCVKVLRMGAGDEIRVTDGMGSVFRCLLIDANPKHCHVSIVSEERFERLRDYRIEIAFAPTKQIDRNEWFVEKATEIGIEKLTPILTDFSERKDIKLERLQKIAISAMKQSHQLYLPEISKMTAFNEIISTTFAGRKFIAHCYDRPKKALSKIYNKSENVLLLIGPEGDFSENEINIAVENGFEEISLGETRLRTETACITAVHTIHVINNQ